MFAIAGVILFVGFLGELIFQKTNIPDVIWLMIIGALLGYFFDIANAPGFNQIAPIFTTFALIYILFEGAINIDIKKLVKGVIGGSSLSVLSFLISKRNVSMSEFELFNLLNYFKLNYKLIKKNKKFLYF